MGLKNKNSIFDLVEGNNPVESMDGQIGPPSQLPIDVASQTHIDSLQVVPGGTQNSPYQDLDGQQGPQFQQPTDVASQTHINSLQAVPGGTQNSPHQDLNGLPDPDFNTLNGTSDSPFKGPDPFTSTGDHMIDLLTLKSKSTNTGQTYQPAPNSSPYQDLDGQQGPQFQLPVVQASQVHIDSLQQVPQPPSNSPFQDLDGNPGPSFNGGPNSTIQPDSLVNIYQSGINQGASYGAGQPTGTWPSVNPSAQDLDGNPGPTFDLGDTSTLQQNSLLSVPQPPSNSPYQDMDGNPGPTFDLGDTSTLQQDSLLSVPQPPSNSPYQDMDGNPGPNFDNGIGSTLKQDLLANIYQSGINPGASYGAGQPGGIWPSINPSPLASTPFADLNGITPSQYLNNLPG
jgi:hypothetical protein